MFRTLTPVWNLRNNAEKNIPYYLDGNTEDLFVNEHLIELGVDIANNDFDLLKQSNDTKYDIENSIIIYEKLRISPRLAREQRLWTYITHTIGLEYAKSRWPLPKPDLEAKNPNKEIVNQIKNHFITLNNKRAIDRDNAISRLWMSAYISDCVEGMELSECLHVLLKTTDFRESVVGRPTIIKCQKLLNAIIYYAKGRMDDNDEEFFDRKPGYYKKWLEKINLQGGVTLFDALEQKEVNRRVEEFAEGVRP